MSFNLAFLLKYEIIKSPIWLTKEINNKWIQKFTHKLKEDDTKSNGKLLNTHVGFMIYNERYDIIFKTKNLKTTSIGRIRKGIRCSAGQTKDTLINIINKVCKNFKWKIIQK